MRLFMVYNTVNLVEFGISRSDKNYFTKVSKNPLNDFHFHNRL